MITLRPVDVADIDTFFVHQADPVAVEMAATKPRDEAAHFEIWTTQILVNPDGIARAVLVDGVVAGNIISWLEDGQRFVGYRYGREYWGQGIATQALRQFVAEVADRPLHAEVAVHNIGSQRVLERTGFRLVSDIPKVEGDGVALLSYQLD